MGGMRRGEKAKDFQGTMRQGYEGALLRLADLMKECDRIEKSVNLIGLCQDDYKAEADIKEIKRLLSRAGISVNCVISDCTYRELEMAPAAELNVVMGQGYDLAREIRRFLGAAEVECVYLKGDEERLLMGDALQGLSFETILEDTQRHYEERGGVDKRRQELMPGRELSMYWRGAEGEEEVLWMQVRIGLSG